MKQLIIFISIIFIFGTIILSPSCANTTTPPSGGKKDTIPPIIVNINPLPGSINVPINTKITFTFNEYIKVKDGKNIFLSPPLSKPVKYKIKGKSLIISFEDTLKHNTTYSLDLTNAVVDNNEGNLFPGYTLVFSTGPKLDNKVVTGTVLDCNTLKPIKGATVLLYKDLSDSAVFKTLPSAAIKTDDWGYFALRNIADTLYRLYAIEDAANNNIYNPQNDKIAFISKPFKPTLTASDTLKELLKYNMKDTLRCLARISEHELKMFKENPTKQMILNKSRSSARCMGVSFMATNPEIDSLWIGGYKSNKVIAQFNDKKDSLTIWLNDKAEPQDTLHLFIDYKKTDSLGALTPVIEHLKLTQEHKKAYITKRGKKLSKQDTTLALKLNANSNDIEQKGFQLNFSYPIINQEFNKIKLYSVNPKRQEKQMPFTVIKDSLDIKNYSLMPKEKLLQGYDYILKVPARIFRDINGFYNDSTKIKVSLPKDDKLSTIILKLQNVKHRYIVDLLNDSRDKIIRSYQVEHNTELKFPYLTKGKYSIRITEDINKNGVVDTGNLLEHRQPEKVIFFKLKNDNFIIELTEGMEWEQIIDVEKMFNNENS